MQEQYKIQNYNNVKQNIIFETLKQDLMKPRNSKCTSYKSHHLMVKFYSTRQYLSSESITPQFLHTHVVCVLAQPRHSCHATTWLAALWLVGESSTSQRWGDWLPVYWWSVRGKTRPKRHIELRPNASSECSISHQHRNMPEWLPHWNPRRIQGWPRFDP